MLHSSRLTYDSCYESPMTETVVQRLFIRPVGALADLAEMRMSLGDRESDQFSYKFYQIFERKSSRICRKTGHLGEAGVEDGNSHALPCDSHVPE